MIQFEHINIFFGYKLHISKMRENAQTLRPQREPIKTPISPTGNYATPSGKPSTWLPLEGRVEQSLKKKKKNSSFSKISYFSHISSLWAIKIL